MPEIERSAKKITIEVRRADLSHPGSTIAVTLTRTGIHTAVTAAGIGRASISVKDDFRLAAYFLDVDPADLELRLGQGRRNADYVSKKLTWIRRCLAEDRPKDALRVVEQLADAFTDHTNERSEHQGT